MSLGLSLRQLAALVEVARHASFTRAAESLHITQAGLSAMVRELETQVDARLFERTTRRVVLTPAGERLLPAARQALDLLGEAVGDVRALGEQARTRLRVGVTPLIATTVMPRVLRLLAERHPGLWVEVLDVDRSVIREQVESGGLDLGLGAFFERESGMRREAILPARLMLAVPAAAGAYGERVAWSALRGRPLIVLPPDNQIQRLADRHLSEHAGTQPRRVVTHLETAIAMAAEGVGVAVVPSFAALAVRRWPVRLVRLTPAVTLDYYRLERAGSHRSEAAQALVDAFVQVMRESGASGPPR
ncbi:LysR family transcriptional regulator [Verticiella sediminum]|uniref:LysR family transcriptional regulator n=1 Tax=Verticiella sediminum TaxID=1247510 RepID=A0A556AQ37_9BURK|nr:LysR family transcriptional regulator [Verticiella sediminum]TSH95018.1 LysR family transcriptional regulator [Verticiella sediminum]